MVFRRDHKRRQVFRESPFDHGGAPDPDTLVKTRSAADERAVVDPNVPRQQSIVYDHHTVPDLAIMRDVNAHHKKIAVAKNSGVSFLRPAMNGAMLANDVGVADLDAAFCLRLKSEILGHAANNRTVTDQVAGAHPDRSLDHHVRLNYALLPDYRVGSDNRKWTDLDLRTKLGVLVYDGGGMNLHSTPASLKLK